MQALPTLKLAQKYAYNYTCIYAHGNPRLSKKLSKYNLHMDVIESGNQIQQCTIISLTYVLQINKKIS
jgi:hypothetical protein